MNTSVSTSKPVRVFSKSKTSLEKRQNRLRKPESSEYIRELSRYIKELSHLENKIQKRSILLHHGYSEINKITSSKDPSILQKVLRTKLTLLIERKNRLLEEIFSVSGHLTAQKKELEKRKSSESSERSSSSSLPSSSVSLESIQASLNEKVLHHYSRYNKTLSEIEELASESLISKEDRRIIYSILFPMHSDDSYPFATRCLRKVFGSRVSTATSFMKEIYRKSSSHDIHMSSKSDAFEIVSCYVHFLRHHSLISSSFIFGSVCTICFILWKSIEILLSEFSSSVSIMGTAILSVVLFGWSTFGILSIFFSWTFGHSYSELRMSSSSSSSSSSSNSRSSNIPSSISSGSSKNDSSNLPSSISSGSNSLSTSKSSSSSSQQNSSENSSNKSGSSSNSSKSTNTSSDSFSSFFNSLFGSSSNSGSSGSSNSHSSSAPLSLSSNNSSSLSGSNSSSNSNSLSGSSSNSNSNSNSLSGSSSNSNSNSNSLSGSSSNSNSLSGSSSNSNSNSNSLSGSSSNSNSNSNSLSGSSSKDLSSSVSSKSSSLSSEPVLSISRSISDSPSISELLNSSSSSSSSRRSQSVGSSSSANLSVSNGSSASSSISSSENSSESVILDSDLLKLFPLFVANLSTSLILCMATIGSIDYLLSSYLPSYSRHIFLLICLSSSLLSIYMTGRRSLSIVKLSSKGSFISVVSLSVLTVSMVLGISIVSSVTNEILDLFTQIHK
ncbi:hypothetical protein NEIRO03_0469 [Nematocida sp. AWRm78]|nr:hypothetical protein NEIRO02_0472 [Nematocida sp. AWRm79]KAI5182827.1 hypothetical protein NEIRO03_0469 [Nematocida sp. AWRm78]